MCLHFYLTPEFESIATSSGACSHDDMINNVATTITVKNIFFIFHPFFVDKKIEIYFDISMFNYFLFF